MTTSPLFSFSSKLNAIEFINYRENKGKKKMIFESTCFSPVIYSWGLLQHHNAYSISFNELTHNKHAESDVYTSKKKSLNISYFRQSSIRNKHTLQFLYQEAEAVAQKAERLHGMSIYVNCIYNIQ